MSKTRILKLVMFVVALVICIGATIYLFPVMKNLSTAEGQVAFKQKVESSGGLGLLSLFALEVAQIFLFIILFLQLQECIMLLHKFLLNPSIFQS